MHRFLVFCVAFLGIAIVSQAAENAAAKEPPQRRGKARGEQATGSFVLKPARVYDGVEAKPHEGWVVVVRGPRIIALGRRRTPGLQRALASSSCPAQHFCLA